MPGLPDDATAQDAPEQTSLGASHFIFDTSSSSSGASRTGMPGLPDDATAQSIGAEQDAAGDHSLISMSEENPEEEDKSKDTEEDVEALDRTGYGWSVGSELHDQNRCRPCSFIAAGTECAAGSTCTFCHLWHQAEKSKRYRPQKSQRQLYKQVLSHIDTTFTTDEGRQQARESLAAKSAYAERLIRHTETPNEDTGSAGSTASATALGRGIEGMAVQQAEQGAVARGLLSVIASSVRGGAKQKGRSKGRGASAAQVRRGSSAFSLPLPRTPGLQTTPETSKGRSSDTSRAAGAKRKGRG